jgi:hypothetical protein
MQPSLCRAELEASTVDSGHMGTPWCHNVQVYITIDHSKIHLRDRDEGCHPTVWAGHAQACSKQEYSAGRHCPKLFKPRSRIIMGAHGNCEWKHWVSLCTLVHVHTDVHVQLESNGMRPTGPEQEHCYLLVTLPDSLLNAVCTILHNVT